MTTKLALGAKSTGPCPPLLFAVPIVLPNALIFCPSGGFCWTYHPLLVAAPGTFLKLPLYPISLRLLYFTYDCLLVTLALHSARTDFLLSWGAQIRACGRLLSQAASLCRVISENPDSLVVSQRNFISGHWQHFWKVLLRILLQYLSHKIPLILVAPLSLFSCASMFTQEFFWSDGSAQPSQVQWLAPRSW